MPSTPFAMRGRQNIPQLTTWVAAWVEQASPHIGTRTRHSLPDEDA
jgi:hypothetical protein